MDPIDFTPVSGFDLPRFAGIPTFMRLPARRARRPARRAGGRRLLGIRGTAARRTAPGRATDRVSSAISRTMIRAENGATGVRPFERARCADLGDVAPNPVDMADGLERVRAFPSRG